MILRYDRNSCLHTLKSLNYEKVGVLKTYYGSYTAKKLNEEILYVNHYFKKYTRKDIDFKLILMKRYYVYQWASITWILVKSTFEYIKILQLIKSQRLKKNPWYESYTEENSINEYNKFIVLKKKHAHSGLYIVHLKYF